MRKKLKFAKSMILLVSIIVLYSNCVTDESSDKEGEAMKKPIYDYVEGWYDKDPERMQLGLHPDLAKRNIDRAQANGVNLMDLPSLLKVVPQYGGAGGDQRVIDIEILDVYGDIATAKVTSNSYVDYVQLGKFDDKWLIINVLWEFISVDKKELTDDVVHSIERPLHDYVEGWYDKDSERIAKGLHPDLAKRSLNPEGINGIDNFTLPTLLEVVPIYGGQNGDDRTLEIEILDVQENIATAKVISNSFVDYVHLSYIDDQWWVLNVLWTFK